MSDNDTDRDGIGDAADACPLLAGPMVPFDGNRTLLQAAYEYLLLSEVHAPVVLHTEGAATCFAGARGPLVHRLAIDEAQPFHRGMHVSLRLRSAYATPSEGLRADVDAAMYTGPLSGRTARLTMVFLDGRWWCETDQTLGAS